MTIEQRLETLERQLSTATQRNRFLVVVMAVAIAGLGVAWLDMLTKTVVSANAFLLTDTDGKTRAMLGVDEDGAELTLRDENGMLGVVLGVGKDGPYLDLYNLYKGLTPPVQLKATKDGPAGLALVDESGELIWFAPR